MAVEQPTAMLPHKEYFRAAKLGEGAFGSVVTVYDDDGAVWAAKVFEPEDEEEEWDEEASEWDARGADAGMAIGAVREMSMLRLLNGAHPNVMRMADVSIFEGEICMIMPCAAEGSLAGAIERKRLTSKQKLRIAALLLHALEWLASLRVMHRDIKPDNVLLDAELDPILTDFSLARVMSESAHAGGDAKCRKKKRTSGGAEKGAAAPHTANMGTPTYTAPEIVRGDIDYGVAADLYSLGVVFYEMFNNKMLTLTKDRHALAHIEEVRAKLSDKPVPSLLKDMLDADPASRVTASAALRRVPEVDQIDLPRVGAALDICHVDEVDDVGPASPRGKRARAPKPAGRDASLSTSKASELLQLNERSTAAAGHFWRRSAAARKLGPAGAAACALLAAKNYELELVSPHDLVDRHPALANWAPEEYAQHERAILRELDYCLEAPA